MLFEVRPKRGASSAVATPNRARWPVEVLGDLSEAEPIPMQQPHDLGITCRKSCKRCMNAVVINVVRRRSRRRFLPKPIGECLPSNPAPSTRCEDSAGHAEQPHPRLLIVSRHRRDAPPRNEKRLTEEIWGIVWCAPPFEVGEQCWSLTPNHAFDSGGFRGDRAHWRQFGSHPTRSGLSRSSLHNWVTATRCGSPSPNDSPGVAAPHLMPGTIGSSSAIVSPTTAHDSIDSG